MDCARVTRLASQGDLLLRYEDRFFADEAVPQQIADKLNLTIPAETAEAIFIRYGTEAMRAFARTLDALPPERLVRTEQTLMDRETQIHRMHIGDARSGKWRELPDQAQAEMTSLFKPFLERFGYCD